MEAPQGQGGSLVNPCCPGTQHRANQEQTPGKGWGDDARRSGRVAAPRPGRGARQPPFCALHLPGPGRCEVGAWGFTIFCFVPKVEALGAER